MSKSSVIITKPIKSHGFYGGVVEYDGKGFCIKLHDNAGEIYLEYREAASLFSLMWKVLFTRNRKKHDKKTNSRTSS